jgi:iron complex outermembrane receptor protein
MGTVTRTLTVITREQIDALPAHSIADVLRLVASVDVRARGVRGVQTDFAIRGANFGQMLVLVDGVRTNDVQSGHHNGDIPVALDDVERIEILHGAGSALFGADAFGGTVNVITRQRIDHPTLLVQGGSFGLASGRGAAGFERGSLHQTMAVSTERSSGFIYDRDYASVIARTRTSIGANSSISIAFLRKEFGANNFYGGNAPSREWTNQTLIAGDHQFETSAGWALRARGSYRTHGDHFIFNQENPALSDNRHRTHAVLGELTASRRVGTGSVTIGTEPAAIGFDRQTLAITSWAGSVALANGGRKSAGVCKWTRRSALIGIRSSARRGIRLPASAGGRRTPCVFAHQQRERSASRRSPSATIRTPPIWLAPR